MLALVISMNEFSALCKKNSSKGQYLITYNRIETSFSNTCFSL